MALYVAPRALTTVLPVPKTASIREGRETGRKTLCYICYEPCDFDDCIEVRWERWCTRVYRRDIEEVNEHVE